MSNNNEDLSNNKIRDLYGWDLGEAAFRKNVINILAEMMDRLVNIEARMQDLVRKVNNIGDL